MKEILFRGQTRKYGEKVNMAGEPQNGIWVFGGIFAPSTDGAFAVMYGVKGENTQRGIQGVDLEKFVVHRDTVGQYTGFNDKNNKKIFEGDIINWLETFNGETYKDTFIVLWEDDEAIFVLQSLIFADCDELFSGFSGDFTFEIVGNIHDTPELLNRKSESVEITT